MLLRLGVGAIGIILIVGMVFVLRSSPFANATTDPGLDSGNATVDRTSVPGQTILKYTTVGNSTFKVPAGVTDVRVMVIGSGGGGGTNGGGGGAGRMVTAPSVAVTPGVSQTITVGNGGSGAMSGSGQRGSDGAVSSIGSLAVAPGGGGGGSSIGGTNTGNGNNGGSGGGVGRDSGIGTNPALTPGLGNQTGTVPVGGTGLGNNGGSATCTGTVGWCGGSGGGGAGAAGGNSSGNSTQGANEVPGNGGNGSANDITGTSTTYAGGGGGGRHSTGTNSIGGSGGGGAGSTAAAVAGAGTPNTGSGGGGGGAGGNGGAGGSGIVVIRFTTQNLPDPGGISGVAMWYKADSAGNTNAQWNDVSGYGRHLTQSTSAQQPVLTANQINFNPAYVFNGTNSSFRMANQGIGGSDGMTAFFGAMSTRNDGGWRYFNEFGDDTPSIGISNGKPELYARTTSPISLTYSTDASGAPHVFAYVSPNANGQNRTVSVDDKMESQNVTTGTYTTNSGGQAGTSFGGTNGSSGTSWAGPIGEAIYFNRVLTDPERFRVFSYLAVKWGITRDQGPNNGSYVDSTGANMWFKDTTFPNRIAGIGRDDTSTLNQKQSKGSSEVTIGRGAIATDNASNSNTFANDRSFLMWGDNGADASQTTAVTGAYKRVNRIWKAVSTNTPGQVQIRVPKTLVDAAGDNGILYTSNSTTFDAGSARTTMTLNGANYEATVTLAAGTSYFTFGALAGSDIEFVSKTATDAGGTAITNYTPGQPIEYVLTVKNNGPDNAGLVTVTDTLPAGIVPTQATGGGWSPCNVAGQTVTCSRPSLNAGITAPAIVIDATIASSVTGQKVNTAQATVANDPDSSNNSASVTLDAAPVADLSIAKEDMTSGNPTAGTNYDYKFTVTNNGPSDIASYTITDTLPSDLTYVSSTPANACTGSSGQNVTCTGGALTKGQSASITITVHVDAGYGGGNLTNTATVAVPAGTTDLDLTNNSSTNNTNVDVSADLTISKTHTGNFVAGEENDFTIAVTNNGPSAAPINAITVTDTLPGNLVYVTGGSVDWSCSEAGGTVTCKNNVAIASLETKSFILTVEAESTARGTTTNTAEVSSTTPDPDLTNNSSTDSPNIIGEADLGVTKTHVGTAFTAGGTEQYTLTVTNAGPSADSPTYTVTDTLPAELTYVSASGDMSCTNTPNPQVVTCTGGEIAANGPAQSVTITVQVSASATGTINNSATVAVPAGTTDPNSANNTGNDSVSVEPNADLSLTKQHTGNLTAGTNESYDLTISNAGPSNVSSFTVTDTLDSNLTYVSAVGATCNATGQDVSCTGGAITSGNQTTVTITVHVESTATQGSTISNTATVTPPTGVNDPNMSNNSGSTTNTIDTSADLSITKTHTGNFEVGSNGAFTLDVANAGPSDASTATVTDVLPNGLTYVSAAGASCNSAGQTVTCEIGPSVSSGQSVPITLTVAVDPDVTATSLANTASVASATPDPDTSNNSDGDTVTIDPAEADLTATKTPQGALTAGAPVTYRFNITNNGPDNAGSVKIDDSLPGYLTYQNFASVSGSWNCSATGQDVTCTLGVLNNGDSAVVDVTVLVAQDAPTPAVNNATVSFNGTDTSSNTPSTSDPVSYSADLEADITHESKTYHSGDTVKYIYTVINHGPSAAEDVVLTDKLPEGLNFESIVASAPGADQSVVASVFDTLLMSESASAAPNTPFNCSVAGQDVACNANTLFVGTYIITMTAKIADNFTGNLASTLQISSSTPDPNLSNNTSIDTIQNVLLASGLAGTGQNLFIWSSMAVAMIAGSMVLVRLVRKRMV